MGRNERRAQEKNIRKKLTPQQFEDLKAESHNEAVKKKLAAAWKELAVYMYEILRQNKIGEDRAKDIMMGFDEAAAYVMGEVGKHGE